MSDSTKQREGSKLTFRDVVAIFFYTKRVFIFTFIGVLIGAILLAFLSPPSYKVTARLVVKPRFEKPVIFEGANPRFNVADRVDQQTLNTIVHLFSAPDVVREVVRQHDLAPMSDEPAVKNEVSKIQSRIKVEPLALSDIIQVTYRAGDAEDARDQLNTLLDSYIAYHIRVNQGVDGSMEFFDQQARFYRDKYIKLSNELAAARKNLNIANPNIQADNQLAVVRDLEMRKAEIDGRINLAAERLAYIRAAHKKIGSDGFVGLSAQVRQSYPALVEMERSLAQLIINKQRAESDYLPGAKPVDDARQQLSNMRRQIRTYMDQIIDGLRVELDSAQKELGAVQESIRNANANVGQLSSDGVILQRIEFDRDLAEQNYRLYENKREEARISDEKDRSLFANVSIASRPSAPNSPWFPNRPLIIMLAIPLALVLALIASLLAYTSDQTLRNPSDVTSRTRLRLLGSLDAV